MSPDDVFDSFALSHVGLVRTANEDSFVVRADLGLWAVADGMGGHAAGDVASAAIVERLARIPVQSEAAALLRACETQIHDANRDITNIAAQRGLGVMGSTVVALLVFGRHYACLWAGDSRAYRITPGESATQLTRDHTEAEQLVAEGVLSEAEARLWPRRNVITRAVGASDDLTLDLVNGEMLPGDAFILCSDGLTAHVEPHEIAGCLQDADAESACRALVDLALARGGSDNVTVIALRYRGESQETQLRPADGRSGTRPR